MIKYTFKRLLQSFGTLLIVITLVFLLMRLMPEEGYFGTGYEKLDEGQREAILTSMGLRDPLHKQLQSFYKEIFKGDLGKSVIYRPKVSIALILKSKIPYSIKFGLAAMGCSLFIGVPMGVLMALGKDNILDKIGTGYIVFINAVPAAVYYLFFLTFLLHKKSNPISFLFMPMI